MMLRRATTGDIDFLADCIIESEKSGTEVFLWEPILQISKESARELVINILNEEIEGQEWNPSHFWILDIGGPAGGLSAWVEGIAGQSSGFLKSQAISWMHPMEWQEAQERLSRIQNIQIPRITGALELENIYISVEHRGKGLVQTLIKSVIEEEISSNSDIKIIEIQLMAENESALKSYTKCGFLKRMEKEDSDMGILNLLPGKKRVSLTLTLNHE